MSYILIIGSKSDIAKACARAFAKDGYDVYLASRSPGDQKEFVEDLRLRANVKVEALFLDISDLASHHQFYEQLPEKPLGVLSAVGYLGDQEKSTQSSSELVNVLTCNYVGVVSLLNLISRDFKVRKSGFIIGISSVAGDRGRKSNYLYGSAKAGLTAYLSGLRNELAASQVHVMTVLPGFVRTQMTAGMPLPEKLTATPEEVAEKILKAQKSRSNVVYVKWFWRWIMAIICGIPEPVFKKLNL